MRKILKKVTAMVLVASFIMPSFTVFANPGGISGLNGSGTSADPYLISNATQLRLIEEDMSANYKLTADINLNNQQWKPIGKMLNSSSPDKFSGILDGNGFSIKNIRINESVGGAVNSYTGLFYYLDGATIKNISLDDVAFRNSSPSNPSMGALAGYARNVRVLNSNFDKIDFLGGSNIGGVIGYLDGSLEFQNVHVTGNIQASGFFASGLVGYGMSTDSGDSVSFKNSSFSGRLANSGTSTAGIYGGLIEGTNTKMEVIQCSVTANVGNAPRHSGLLGIVKADNLVIRDCYVNMAAEISPFSTVALQFAGMALQSNVKSQTSVQNNLIVIETADSKGRGTITATPFFGSVMGTPINVVNSYYNSDYTLINDTSMSSHARTATQLNTPATYVGWDTSVWDMSNGSFPMLKEVVYTEPVIVPSTDEEINQAALQFFNDMSYAEYLLEDTGLDFKNFLEVMETLSSVPNLQEYISYFETQLSRERVNVVVTGRSADLIRQDEDYVEMSNFTSRMEMSTELAKVNLNRTKPNYNDEDLKEKTIYMYLSHFVDRTSPYDPIGNPLDDPHFATYLTRNDEENYDLFMAKLGYNESWKMAYDAIAGVTNVRNAIKSGQATKEGFKLASEGALSSIDTVKNYFKDDPYKKMQNLENLGKGVDSINKNLKYLAHAAKGGSSPEEVLENLDKYIQDDYKGQEYYKDANSVAFSTLMCFGLIATGVVAMMAGAMTLGIGAVALGLIFGGQITSNLCNFVASSIKHLYQRAAELSLLITLSMRRGYRYMLYLYGEDWS